MAWNGLEMGLELAGNRLEWEWEWEDCDNTIDMYLWLASIMCRPCSY